MAIHPTLSDLHFRKSVMKFIMDQLVTVDDLVVKFEPTFEAPRDDDGNVVDAWVEVKLSDKEFEDLGSAFVLFDIYTRKDSEGFDNARILDLITDMLTDEESTNGTAFIPYYDTTVEGAWTTIGGMIPLHRRTTEIWPAKDSTSVRTVSYELKWGAK
jgi:hypothetical protein